MKNLKSFAEHERLAGALHSGDAKVITYGMSDNSYIAYGASFLNVGDIAANFDGDKNKWGGTLECGVKIIPLDELRVYYEKSDGLIIMSRVYFSDIAEYLDSLGLDYYHGCFMIGGLQEFIADVSRSEAETIAANRDKVKQARALLTDERSEYIYERMLAARSSSDVGERFEFLCDVTTADQYFYTPSPCEGLAMTDNEIFVDGGAYTGDTARKFIKHTGGRDSHIYAFEPDPLSFEKLRKLAAGYDNFTCYSKGLYGSEGVLKFTCADTGSRLEGTDMESNPTERINHNIVEVEVCSIDETVCAPVTFIKMDIEGSELEALKGAERTIRQYKPKLAICIYHKIEDFWEIPLYIHELVPEYKFYVRHHLIDPFCTETVLYAAL